MERMFSVTDEEIDKLLLALSREGFEPPFGPVDVERYLWAGMSGSEREAGLVAMRAADDQQWESNRKALRAALEA